MCGICGALGADVDEHQLRSATDLIWHRGPDEAGYYLDADVALGMRRLSIIDLAGGAQPKTDERGIIQVIFNGEIYNYRELRSELSAAGHEFSSSSDTEVIAHGYEEWGLDCFAHFNGIFAIAIWDREKRELVLARDHLGIKPLYWGSWGHSLVFGSELKPLLALLPETPAIDPQSVALFLRYQYVPAPRSIFEGISKLPPAHYMVVRPGESNPPITAYWDPMAMAAERRGELSPAEAEDLVAESLASSVKRQLVSDVRLGAFLSGGVDSSLVVAMMQGASPQITKTFSIGFRESNEDESPYARAVAEYLGTEHHEWIVTDQDALAVVPKLPYYYDEPFADQSAIPTYLVSELARRHVTVSLSGDGGDELFGGYRRYGAMRRMSPWWRVPAPLRRASLWGASRIPGRIGTLPERGARILACESLGAAYRNMVAVTPDSLLARLTSRKDAAYTTNDEWPEHVFAGRSLDEGMMLADLVTYLPDAILTKVDRASMAHSLEARVPLLDPRFVELALSLPPSVRIGSGSKTLLKNVLKRHIPASLVDRPKHGFGIPVHEWLRGGLRDCMTDYLAPGLIGKHGLLDGDGVDALIHEHLAGSRDRGYALWAILMFQMWYEEFYQSRAWRRAAPPAIDAPISA